MSAETAESFLSIASQFKLGDLATERSNPLTAQLSQLCQTKATLPDGLAALQAVDVAALTTILGAIPQIETLASVIHSVFHNGKKVVCEGCGATGRLSLSLETFAKEGMVPEPEYQDKVLGFMAGGDAAFIRSIESFEDNRSYGERQLDEIGFEDGDLLIAITEGGETPFVIAACERAATISAVAPYFVYCNPDDVLCSVAERSRKVIENDAIVKINLCVGPMAITGSTRMQATTVQLTSVGLAIQYHATPQAIGGRLRALAAALHPATGIDYRSLAPVTSAEADLYRRNQYFLYETDYFSVTLMTDTTERSPTFSLPPFENFDNPQDAPTPCYLRLQETATPIDAWRRLLRREPRTLEWPECAARAGLATILGYDFSDSVQSKRVTKIGAERSADKVVLSRTDRGFQLSVHVAGADSPVIAAFDIADDSVRNDKLLLNVVAKCVLNAHSTAVMGVNGRYEGNVMTFVKATNNKLIDRACRYVLLLLQRRGVNPLPSYEDVVRRVFEKRAVALPSDPVVLLVVESFVPK